MPSGFFPTRSPILHVALEYTLPQVASSQLMYGGMGLVVDTFLKVSRAWCGTNLGMSIRHALLLALNVCILCGSWAQRF